MKNRILKNLQLNLLITIITGVLGFVINKYFSEYMGMEILGLMRLFSQLIAYLSLAELGVGTASAYALYRPLLEQDTDRINTVLSTINSFYKKIALFILIVGILLNFTLSFFIKFDYKTINIYIYWSLYVINTSIGYIFAKYSILFTANQEYGFVRKIQGIGRIIFQGLQLFSIIIFQSFNLFIILLICENVFNFYFLKKHYNKEYFYIKNVKNRDKNIIKDIKNIFWHKLAGVIVFNTDYIILSTFLDLSIIAIYSSYLIIYQMVMTIMNISTPVLSPHIGKFVAQNNKEKIYLYWKELYYLHLVLAIIVVFVTYKVINPFIELWIGKEYLLPDSTVILIMINLFINITRKMIDVFSSSSGFFDDIHVPFLESIINFVLSIVLVQYIGLNGVIFGTVVSNILIICILKPMLTFKRCFDKSGVDYIKEFIINLGYIAISIGLLNLVIGNFEYVLNFNSWLDWIISSVKLTIITIIIVVSVFLFNKYFREILKKYVFILMK